MLLWKGIVLLVTVMGLYGAYNMSTMLKQQRQALLVGRNYQLITMLLIALVAAASLLIGAWVAGMIAISFSLGLIMVAAVFVIASGLGWWAYVMPDNAMDVATFRLAIIPSVMLGLIAFVITGLGVMMWSLGV